MTTPTTAEDAAYHALLFVLQWSNDDARRLRAMAGATFIRALEQDGYRVVPAIEAAARAEAVAELLSQRNGLRQVRVTLGDILIYLDALLATPDIGDAPMSQPEAKPQLRLEREYE